MSAAKELVLPGTGAFATLRPLKGADYFALHARDQKLYPDIVAFLITRCALIEGKPLTYAELLEMDFRDIGAMSAEIGKYLTGPAAA